MPKRYFCDYCNKSFQDNRRNRSKHMRGFYHLRNKEMHFNNGRARMYDEYCCIVYESCPAVQRSPPTPEEQQRLMVFHTSYSGEELFQQWLKHHPAVVKRYEGLRSSPSPGPKSTVKEEQAVDSMHDQNSTTAIDSQLS